MKDSNKASNENQGVTEVKPHTGIQNPVTPQLHSSTPRNSELTHTTRTPTPHTYNGKEYYRASDIAKILGVSRIAVVKWNNNLWHGAPWFTADLKTHDGVYLYSVERVMRLKSVYHPDWHKPPVLRKDEPETFGNFMNGVFGDVLGGKTAETPATKTETFVDLQSMVTDVLSGYAEEFAVGNTPVASEQKSPVKPNPEKSATTTSDKKSDEDAKYRKEIADIYSEAVRRLDKLPTGDMRGLDLETFQRLGFGFLPAIRHPKYPKSSPSPRFIVRLGDNNDPPSINMILTPSGRKRFTNKKDKASEKTLSAGDKLLFYPTALEDITFFVTEGEINAASIMQATKWNVKACALGGAGIFGDLKRRLAELPSERREQLNIYILFDKDAESKTGQNKSAKLQKQLADMGIAGLPVFVDDFLSTKQKETFAKAKNIDPNDILQKFGDSALSLLIDKIRDDTRADFSRLKDEIRQLNLFRQEQDKQPTEKKSSAVQKDTADYDSFRARIMLDTIDPAALDYPDWLSVISACKNIGVDYSIVDKFNSRDASRYDAGKNLAAWNGVHDSSFDIQTLHGIAKRFGYTEADVRCKWYEIHPELKPSKRLRNIAEETQRELDNAIIWLETLSLENFSADDAYNPDNIRAVALAQLYGFAAVAEKFFAIIKTSKALAQTRIKEADTGFIAPLDTDELARLGALANLHLETLRKNVAREVQALNREQKAFAKEQAEEQARQKAVKAQSERQARIEENIKTLIELRAEYKKNPSKELAKKMRKIIFNSCDVTTDRYTGEVKAVKTTTENADLIFTFDPYLDGTIGFDEFQQADVYLKKMPWHKSNQFVGKALKNRDVAQIRYYLSKYYREFGTVQKVDDAIIRFSDKHSFHPVKDYFNNLPKWDGKKRAEELFIKFLRVDDTPYAREITLNWLSAAVARIFHPGCEYQIAPILHGNQGIGKGYILKRLGGKWYGAIGENVDDSHAVDSIQNLWIGEFKEMKALRRADINAIKAFIDTSSDNRRPPYGMRSEFFPRHIVFFITVNDDQFLSDVTGNRRFPVLECHLPRGQYLKGLTDEYISQVWAEVYHYYCELRDSNSDISEPEFVKILEEKLELSAETRQQVEDVAQRFMRDDGLTGEIEAFLNAKIPPAVIWNLLSKEERRKFYAEGQITVDQTELNSSRRARGGRNVQKDIEEIDRILRSGKGVLKKTIQFKGEPPQDRFVLFGVEYREHICAAEILNEAFAANDKRKSMFRIHEILATLSDWELGKRTPRDLVYGDQRKVFYRTSQPDEPTTDDMPEPTTRDDNGNHNDHSDHNNDEPRSFNPETQCHENSNPQSDNNSTQKDSHNTDDFIGEYLLEDPPF